MPTAGDEGYEKLVVCPYDKAHEIRKGRMQFHLKKCRVNYPTSQLVECNFNKTHLVPKEELNWHMEEDCDSRATWDRFAHDVETKNVCPVRDLVPVNTGTVPDSDENWDSFETAGSVLNHIKAEVETKPVLRQLPTESKAKRRAFRQNERQRINSIAEQRKEKPVFSDTASVVSTSSGPLRKPTIQPNMPVKKQDPSKALAAINKQFRTLDLDMKLPKGIVAPSETSSVFNGPPSEFETASTSRKMPYSFATASQQSTNTTPRPDTALSNSTLLSFATAQAGALDRPSSSMSNSSLYSSVSSMPMNNGNPPMFRPPNSTTYRPSTAMNISASVASSRQAVDDDGFCQIPIPGLGRGKRKPAK